MSSSNSQLITAYWLFDKNYKTQIHDLGLKNNISCEKRGIYRFCYTSEA